MNIERLIQTVDKEILGKETQVFNAYKMRWFLASLPTEIAVKLPDAMVAQTVLTFDDLTASEVKTVVKLIPGAWTISRCPVDDDMCSYHLYLTGITIRVWRGEQIKTKGLKAE